MSGEATRRQQDTPSSPKNTQEESDQRFPGRQDEGRQPNPKRIATIQTRLTRTSTKIAKSSLGRIPTIRKATTFLVVKCFLPVSGTSLQIEPLDANEQFGSKGFPIIEIQ